MDFRSVNFRDRQTETDRHRKRQTEKETDRQTDRQTDRVYFVIVRHPAHDNRSEPSGNTNFYTFSDELKLCFQMFEALKTEFAIFSLAGPFVLANQ